VYSPAPERKNLRKRFLSGELMSTSPEPAIIAKSFCLLIFTQRKLLRAHSTYSDLAIFYHREKIRQESAWVHHWKLERFSTDCLNNAPVQSIMVGN